MTQRSYRWLAVTLAVIGLAADQATKYGMFKWLYNEGQHKTDGAFRSWSFTPQGGVTQYHGEYDVVPGWFKFTAEFGDTPKPCDCAVFGPLQTLSADKMPHVNQGALFGFLREHKELSNGLFATVSILAALGICFWLTRKSAAHDRWLSAALGLILGGTVGNFYDRIVFNGVRDFLYFYKIDWPVFNVADCCLVVGAIMLLIHAFLTPSEPKPEQPTVAPLATPIE